MLCPGEGFCNEFFVPLASINHSLTMKLANVIPFAACALLLGSCGVNQALVLNQNQNATQVHLSEGNFRNVGKVSGKDSVRYIMLFGGAKKRSLYGNAYSAMLEEAQLSSGPRAVVNVVTEDHIGGFPPFCVKRALTVTGQVVEFTR